MKFHNVEQNTDDWFKLRCGKVTASEFKTCMSKDTTKGYWDLIYKKRAEIRTGEVEESYTNKWMDRGHELEPLAKEAYELYTFETIHNGGFFQYNEYIGASPDGLIDDDGLIEIKCPKASTMERYISQGELPAEYYYQVHGQLLCSNRKYVEFVAYHPSYELFIQRIFRQESVISDLESRLNLIIKLINNK